eukprot:CAMPEP_0201678118 /NCGR_PEP_ID=MMETSP0494-20130426/45573_1 /ASSEMBLY_ACC=CAM_ASM_000839 /TAXON_ID=420259 /ORGANISM="Thalassiosira gravida, Strain GMp14c1" /LENGTH=91 /DNA_ID=CAMNT_0048161229 /DNA_START=45 /DNA_END=317 /DNA_ORIENTATION=+
MKTSPETCHFAAESYSSRFHVRLARSASNSETDFSNDDVRRRDESPIRSFGGGGSGGWRFGGDGVGFGGVGVGGLILISCTGHRYRYRYRR